PLPKPGVAGSKSARRTDEGFRVRQNERLSDDRESDFIDRHVVILVRYGSTLASLNLFATEILGNVAVLKLNDRCAGNRTDTLRQVNLGVVAINGYVVVFIIAVEDGSGPRGLFQELSREGLIRRSNLGTNGRAALPAPKLLYLCLNLKVDAVFRKPAHAPERGSWVFKIFRQDSSLGG